MSTINSVPKKKNKTRIASSKQDAVRLLFILAEIGEAPSSDAPEGAVLYIEGQAKLQALDFWLRNPDYLANELLNEYQKDKLKINLFYKAKEILNSDELVTRNFPMLRYLFGAFEALDNSFSILSCYKFATFDKISIKNKTKIYKYYLYKEGLEAAIKIVKEYPDLSWYQERCRLIKSIFGDLPGSKLKEMQHQQSDYHNTSYHSPITNIKDKVQKRLLEIKKNDKLD